MRFYGYAAACAALVLACLPSRAISAGVDVAAFVKKDRFETIKLSPTGEYYAAAVPLADRTALVILRRPDNKVTATFNTGKNTHVSGFWWVNHERVLISMAEKFGSLDQPQLTGELYAMPMGVAPICSSVSACRAPAWEPKSSPRKSRWWLHS